ncbi:MAG: hypothetical protein K8Q97_01490 [Candidatus Andersenbacteria bacterium]|nr:hypothetical protein [Candidatus Andersenbacteria bacterium]
MLYIVRITQPISMEIHGALMVATYRMLSNMDRRRRIYSSTCEGWVQTNRREIAISSLRGVACEAKFDCDLYEEPVTAKFMMPYAGIAQLEQAKSLGRISSIFGVQEGIPNPIRDLLRRAA